jgi:ubiquinone/menaquinone biosynthesis C-methylase UbiE
VIQPNGTRGATASPHFVFDQIATQYSAQRAFPPDVTRTVGAAIAAQTGNGRGDLLEIGVGTGLIAWPAATAGCRVVGIDLSPGMLAEVPRQRPADTPAHRLALIEADMHHLPCADASFDGVILVRTLHLAKEWRQVLRESARVLRPGGSFMLGRHWIDPMSVTGRLRLELRKVVMMRAPKMEPPAAYATQEAYLKTMGGEAGVEHMVVEWQTHISPAAMLDAQESRQDNESWILDDQMLPDVMAQLRTWAPTQWEDMTTPQAVTNRFYLQVVRGQWHTPPDTPTA